MSDAMADFDEFVKMFEAMRGGSKPKPETTPTMEGLQTRINDLQSQIEFLKKKLIETLELNDQEGKLFGKTIVRVMKNIQVINQKLGIDFKEEKCEEEECTNPLHQVMQSLGLKVMIR